MRSTSHPPPSGRLRLPPPPLACRHRSALDLQPTKKRILGHVTEAVLRQINADLGKARRNRSLRSVVVYLLDRLPHASLAEAAGP